MRKIANWLVPFLLGVVMIVGNVMLSECSAKEKAFPSQDIHFVVQTKAGGGYDTIARALAPVLEKYLPGGVHVIIENKPGGGGKVGYTYVYRSRPDGYTFCFCSIPGAVATQLVSDVAYDLSKVKWIGTAVQETHAIFVKADSKTNSFADLLALGKKRKLKACLSMIGDTSHLQLIILGAKTGLNFEGIAGYGGSKAAMVGMIRGDGDFISLPQAGFAQEYTKTGEIKPIFGMTGGPSPLYPGIGYAEQLGFSLPMWLRCLFAPPGTPDDRVRILEVAFGKACKDKELQDWVKKSGQPIEWIGSAETSKQIKDAFASFTEYRDILKKHVVPK
jgi:tripartite-type tricarboxylate transporter receptor subunit TctC